MTEKLYRTVFEVEVLSDRPVNDRGLRDIAEDIVDGDLSGVVQVKSAEEVSRAQMSQLLLSQGSDPEFLLGDDAWKYAIHPGDEITLQDQHNKNFTPKVTVAKIVWMSDEVAVITSRDGATFEVTIDEIS
jgi:hypothetical protein